MFDIMSDEELMDQDWSSLVLVEGSKKWPGQLVWQSGTGNNQGLTDGYRDYISRFGQLNELFMLEPFAAQLAKDGYTLAFSESAVPVIEDHDRWIAPLSVDGLDLRKWDGTKSQLYDYQRFSLNRALERCKHRRRHDRFFYFGWGPGTGKSAACAAGALEAIHRDDIDLVLAFTMRKLKLNLRDFFTTATPLDVVVCDGTKERRRRLWNSGAQVFVNNFDKAHFDHDEIARLIAGKRVLFIFDEVEFLLSTGDAGTHTRTRKAMNDLMENCCVSTAWPMSASVVDSSPMSYFDNYSLGVTKPVGHPLGGRKDFEKRYLLFRTSQTFDNPHGRGYFTVHKETWDHVGLQEVRHRVSHATQNARQTDPGVRENFPGISTIVIPIQLSEQDRKLYDIVKGWARAAYARGESPAEHVEIMRYICNHPGALGITRHPLGARLGAEHPKLITGANSSKLEVFCDQVQQMAAAGEKVVGFTKYTDLCLHLVSAELRRRRISFVDHHSEMSDKVAYEHVQQFKSDPDVTLFWSSDVGSHGLSFQMSRYVISYDVPLSWRKLFQRMSRINRADGDLDGRISYVYVTDNTCETRFWVTNNERRMLAEATSGAREEHTWNPETEDSPHSTDIEEILA